MDIEADLLDQTVELLECIIKHDVFFSQPATKIYKDFKSGVWRERERE